ncbi:hypothetical protein [Rhodopila globiformis]|nr:hypothetical protein [Rhodopila globiformis]
MKRFICAAVLAACVIGPSALAQSAINTVVAVANPRHYEGRCPASIAFVATISVNQPTKVSYRWERSDGATGRVETAVIRGRGHGVTTTWTLSRRRGETFKGAQTLHLLSPGNLRSNPAEFTLVCR